MSQFLAKEQRKDPDIGSAVAWVTASQRPPWEQVRPCGPALCALWRQFESLVFRDGVFCRLFYMTDGTIEFFQCILSASLRFSFLELIHGNAAGHLKFAKSSQHLIRRAWWYSWRTDLKIFIDCCEKCAAFHRGPAPRQTSFHPMKLGAPNQRLVINLCGPFSPSNQYRFIFTVIDPYTKFVIAVGIRNKKTLTIAKVLVKHVFPCLLYTSPSPRD